MANQKYKPFGGYGPAEQGRQPDDEKPAGGQDEEFEDQDTNPYREKTPLAVQWDVKHGVRDNPYHPKRDPQRHAAWNKKWGVTPAMLAQGKGGQPAQFGQHSGYGPTQEEGDDDAGSELRNRPAKRSPADEDVVANFSLPDDTEIIITIAKLKEMIAVAIGGDRDA